MTSPKRAPLEARTRAVGRILFAAKWEYGLLFVMVLCLGIPICLGGARVDSYVYLGTAWQLLGGTVALFSLNGMPRAMGKKTATEAFCAHLSALRSAASGKRVTMDLSGRLEGIGRATGAGAIRFTIDPSADLDRRLRTLESIAQYIQDDMDKLRSDHLQSVRELNARIDSESSARATEVDKISTKLADVQLSGYSLAVVSLIFAVAGTGIAGFAPVIAAALN